MEWQGKRERNSLQRQRFSPLALIVFLLDRLGEAFEGAFNLWIPGREKRRLAVPTFNISNDATNEIDLGSFVNFFCPRTGNAKLENCRESLKKWINFRTAFPASPTLGFEMYDRYTFDEN